MLTTVFIKRKKNAFEFGMRRRATATFTLCSRFFVIPAPCFIILQIFYNNAVLLQNLFVIMLPKIRLKYLIIVLNRYLRHIFCLQRYE